jgi:hypothetical protein
LNPNKLSRDEDKIFCTLYHGDRLASLILGLPYASIDAHHKITLENCLHRSDEPKIRMQLASSWMIGRFLDHILTSASPSPQEIQKLDAMLQQIRSVMPLEWWDYSKNLHMPRKELRSTLLGQISFYHIRMYIHMPLLIGTPSRPAQASSRAACVSAAQELLSRTLVLRRGPGREPLFRCETHDFISLVAAIIIILGSPPNGSFENIRTLMDQFEHEGRQEKEKRKSQYRDTLSLLMDASNAHPATIQTQIKVPYLGTVMRKLPCESITHGNTPVASNTETPMLTASNEGAVITESTDPTPFAFSTEEPFWEMLQSDNFVFEDISPWLDNDIDFNF